MFDHLYDVSEQAQVHFVGCITERARYDFSIVYTNHFFGKTIVICMQTGRSTLLSAEDLANLDNLQQSFNIPSKAEAEELRHFLTNQLPSLGVRDQY